MVWLVSFKPSFQSLSTFVSSFVRSFARALLAFRTIWRRKNTKKNMCSCARRTAQIKRHTPRARKRERENCFDSKLLLTNKLHSQHSVCTCSDEHQSLGAAAVVCSPTELIALLVEVQIVTRNFDSPTLAQSITIDWQQAKRSKAIHSFKQGAGSFASEKSACIVCINDAKYLIWFDFVSVQFTICKAYASDVH